MFKTALGFVSRLFGFPSPKEDNATNSLYDSVAIDSTSMDDVKNIIHEIEVPERIMFSAKRSGYLEAGVLPIEIIGLCKDDSFMLSAFAAIRENEYPLLVNFKESGYINNRYQWVSEIDAIKYLPRQSFFPAHYPNKTNNENKRMVVAAAVQFDNTVVIGVRHYDPLMNDILDLTVNLKRFDAAMFDNTVVEGFVDQHGNFMDRIEAYKVVEASGQPFYPQRNKSTEELYSEGVW